MAGAPGAGGTAAAMGGGLASRVRFVRSPAAVARQERVLYIDVAKLDRELAKDRNFHVGPGGTGAAIKGRYQEARAFLERAARDGTKVHMTRLHVDKDGRPSIGDGRHRFAVLRDSGARVIPVTVPRGKTYERARRLFGAR